MTTGFCPCQSGLRFHECCGSLLAGERVAATAEELMRSRYTAFARGNADYLRRTWAPATRPDHVDLDPDITWRRLEVIETCAGGLDDDEGWVNFAAHHRIGAERGTLRERSRFVRIDGRWFYVDGWPS